MINGMITTPNAGIVLPVDKGVSQTITQGPDASLDVFSTQSVKQATTASNEKDTSQKNDMKKKPDEILDSIKKINYLLGSESFLKFESDEGVDIVKIIDTETKKVIRQIPSEDIVNFQHRLETMIKDESTDSGLLIEDKV